MRVRSELGWLMKPSSKRENMHTDGTRQLKLSKMLQPLTPCRWSDAGIASIGVMNLVNCHVRMGCYSQDAKCTTICLMEDILGGAQREMISVPTEKERTVTGMAEYIEREAAKARLRIWITDCVLYGDNDEADCFRRCIDLIDSIPATDVSTVRHGRWRFGKDLPDSFGSINKNKYHLYCSECRNQAFNKSTDNDCNFDMDTPFCPWCGAKMDGEGV